MPCRGQGSRRLLRCEGVLRAGVSEADDHLHVIAPVSPLAFSPSPHRLRGAGGLKARGCVLLTSWQVPWSAAGRLDLALPLVTHSANRYRSSNDVRLPPLDDVTCATVAFFLENLILIAGVFFGRSEMRNAPVQLQLET